MTPSLANLFWSLFWGALVLGAIFGGLFFISQKDKIQRRS
ncbi:photosystem II reaction center X protein [Oxynema sp. CENA135]|jgi:hypothetical protein|uniref:Photosystem II reaction center protein X n=1 Tax=Oxynema aestuarii AP17 TaxID=2064643 RepID=A0A6H1TTT2_9CYAN|nr:MULTISPECIES: photosystem II reaction center X protein [Oxynema]MBK4730372.1 photosystem II reaction center X protein [Oxynema sp. CENA135]QIZ70014.1 Photosystem II reaction center X protein [Oxynema aestuarii AP17]RMH75672.1 MAG: Photosystem II reaction center X protein [Cyanobacteria bacterium J007]